ncbi:MAG: molybdopterin-dependent oxidoreductase, partial [Nitrospira sp.]|nr:molybdopterin-dependent oxidoreductase [Nitrospira sp.]
ADTVCGYCGDGCQMTVQTKDQELIEVNSAHGAGRNNGDLCARGFFGFHAASHPDRLTHPLIRRNGALVQTTWEDALEYVATRVGELKKLHGQESFGGLISGRCTNEELYVFQKFMRGAIGTNNIDSSARYGHVNGLHAMRLVQGTHRWTVTFDDVLDADVLVLVGTNITETNPITGLKVKEAVKKRRATLITIESLEPVIDTMSNIANLSHHHFRIPPSEMQNGILGLLKAVLEENLVPQDLSQRYPAYVTAVTTALRAFSWQDLQRATGIEPDSFVQAARVLAAGRRVIVLTGQVLLRSERGYAGSLTLLDLLILTGKLDQPGCGFAPLAEENNDQGAVEMGAIAEFLPGACSTDNAADRERFMHLWKKDLPLAVGASLVDMLHRAHGGSLKAMFIVGENPVASLPAPIRAEDSLRKLDLLVCQELFLTETAALAHVVLPAASSMEKTGTFTNTEGHVQAVRPSIEPIGESRPDWEVFAALSTLLGMSVEYAESKDILKEIRGAISGYTSLGPTPLPPKVDPAAIDRYLNKGYQPDLTTRCRLIPPKSRPDGTLQIGFGQSLFHSGKFSTRSKGLLQLEGTGRLRINPVDAARFALMDGDHVRLCSTSGEMTTEIKIMERVPQGTAWFPDHFGQAAVGLFECAIDPLTHVPSFLTATVSMMKVA